MVQSACFVRYLECLNHDGNLACLDKHISAADVREGAMMSKSMMDS